VYLDQPTTLPEALAALASDPLARCLAGGATLVGLINGGTLQPTRLVSLRRVDELKGLAVEGDGSVVIAAMTPHRVVAQAAELMHGHEIVREAAAQTAHPTIRNMATIGGSIAIGDPTADYPCALVAAGGAILVASPGGRRAIPVDDFFRDRYVTALASGEIVTGARLAPTQAGETSAFVKFARVDGDYATLAVGVRVGWAGAICTALRIAIGSFGCVPIRSAQVEATLIGTALTEDGLRAAASAYIGLGAPRDDIKASADYRRLILPGLLLRAVERARGRRGASGEWA
jgi:carbon-monoxide dehydrogenase medium subunit